MAQSSTACDISMPAANAKRGRCSGPTSRYLAAIKEQNGAAMSLGRVTTFLDIYIERDIKNGTLTEESGAGAHRRFRHQAAHDPSAAHAGIQRPVRRRPHLDDGKRRRHGRGRRARWSPKPPSASCNTLYNLGAAPEPNLTVLWSEELPEGFKKFCAQVSIDTDSIQYENDDLMRPDLRRRLRHRLLRIRDEDWQADAVLRCTLQPGEAAAARAERRPRRE